MDRSTERGMHSLSEFIRAADAYIDLHTGRSKPFLI